MGIHQDFQVRGSHVGTYLPSSGVWHHTQRYLKKGASNRNTINHLDFDAPTREHAHQLPDDKVRTCYCLTNFCKACLHLRYHLSLIVMLCFFDK